MQLVTYGEPSKNTHTHIYICGSSIVYWLYNLGYSLYFGERSTFHYLLDYMQSGSEDMLGEPSNYPHWTKSFLLFPTVPYLVSFLIKCAIGCNNHSVDPETYEIPQDYALYLLPFFSIWPVINSLYIHK